MDRTLTISDDIFILSTDPNDMRHLPTLFDALAERTAAMLAYDIARKTDQTVTDVPLLTATNPTSKAALLLGNDPHGTTLIVGMVSLLFSSFHSKNIFYSVNRPNDRLKMRHHLMIQLPH